MKSLSNIFTGINNIPSKAKALGAGLVFGASSLLPFDKAAGQTVAYTHNGYSEVKPTASAVVRDNAASVTKDKEPEKAAPIVLVGTAGTAQDASYKPDAHYIAAYMVVDKDYPRSTDELIAGLKTYFDFYNLPVKFVKQPVPDEGKYFSMRFYVGGHSYDGNMSNGNVTMREIVDNHSQVFVKLQEMYSQYNPEHVPGQALGLN